MLTDLIYKFISAEQNNINEYAQNNYWKRRNKVWNIAIRFQSIIDDIVPGREEKTGMHYGDKNNNEGFSQTWGAEYFELTWGNLGIGNKLQIMKKRRNIITIRGKK